MLLVKPLYLKFTMKSEHHEEDHKVSRLTEESLDGGSGAQLVKSKGDNIDLDKILREEFGKHDHHSFGEIFIHQLIETIEFVLGSISNTASYLRLWALSLAHGQLAEVFFDKLLLGLAFSINSTFAQGFASFFLFPAFASITLFVLMFMDVMECFLHTLRLHWVEFQNKFFKGNGYPFAPFSFEDSLKPEMEKDY